MQPVPVILALFLFSILLVTVIQVPLMVKTPVPFVFNSSTVTDANESIVPVAKSCTVKHFEVTVAVG